MKRAVIIKRARDISRLYNYGQQWKSSNVTIFYLQNGVNSNRYGILVSRENGTAVSRNRFKRIVREFLWKVRETAPPHYDILIKIKSESAKIGSLVLKEDIKKWFTSLKK